MSRTPFVVGNWKLNKTIAAAQSLISELRNQLSSIRDVEVGVAPVFTSLSSVARRVEDSTIWVGAQNCHWEASGAFTGEVSAELARDAGARFVIVGHSERRTLFGDTDEKISKRARAALDAGLRVILCVGETESERDSDQTFAVVDRQLGGALGSLDAGDLDSLVIAYEPVWAIGTGRTATPAQAQEVHAFIRGQLEKRYPGTGSGVRLQYGGSVKPGNAKDLMTQADIDGALVGGASLVADDFVAIVKAARPDSR